MQGPIFSQRDPGGNRDNTHLDQSGKNSAAGESGPGIIQKIKQSFQGTISPRRDPEGNRDNTHLDQSGKSSAAGKSGPGIIENPAILSRPSFSTTGSGREPRQHQSRPTREKFSSGEIRSWNYRKFNNPFRARFFHNGIREGTETTPI